ncbi:MAG TPA: ABC transporter permease [Gemmatimonadales bacterium]|nr:ABC transporter permease [Gemmatimonadales bacterium]
MLTLRLALRSIANRRLTTILTIASIALSVALLIGVETVRRGVRESFAGTIRGTDLIVGARGGTQQLLLSSIFGMGAPAGTFTWATYERWAAHPAVKWTIPVMLGDSYYGYRVIGTTDAYYEHYRYRNDGRVTLAEGAFPAGDRDVVLGAEVAERRKLGLGAEIALTHGLRGTGISDHVEHPFRVVGILAPTFTPIDRSLYVTLEGVEGMHAEGEIGDQRSEIGGQQPAIGDQRSEIGDSGAASGEHNHAEAAPSDLRSPIADLGHVDHQHALSAFLVGTKNRFESLKLQREMNTDLTEPLTAILPAVALTELWHTIGYAESGARIISFAVLLVGLLGMLVSLYSTLQERRREMAILRSLGAGPRRIAALLVLESGLLSLLGALGGLLLAYGTIALGGGITERSFGLFIPITPPATLEWLYLGGVVIAGVLVGLVPAWRAYRNTLQDGLTIRL